MVSPSPLAQLAALGGALALGACSRDVVHDERLTGSYRLVAIDLMDSMIVCRRFRDVWCVGDQMPGPTVFAAGFDDRYVVIARHPLTMEGPPRPPDRSITEYYYVRRPPETEYLHDGDVVGPLPPAAFEAERRRLGLPGFRRTFRELQ